MRFVTLMQEIRMEAEEKRIAEATTAMLIDHALLGNGRTPENPLDLTNAWN